MAISKHFEPNIPNDLFSLPALGSATMGKIGHVITRSTAPRKYRRGTDLERIMWKI